MLKDPQDVLDFAIDWNRSRDGAADGTGWLDADETITASTWTVPDGLTKGAEGNVAGRTVVWLSGGTNGQQYVVTNHITTSQGRQADKSLTINVRQR